MHLSYDFLDSMKLPILDNKNKKFIKFISAGRTVQVITPAKLPELWNIYFFDPAKKPKKADMTMIEEEYKNYYK